MVSLLIRNVDPELHATIKRRATEHGHSMEEEARELIRPGVAASGARQPGLATRMHALFQPLGGLDLPDIPRERLGDPPDFSGPEWDRRDG
jgi:plasmid stability protein